MRRTVGMTLSPLVPALRIGCGDVTNNRAGRALANWRRRKIGPATSGRMLTDAARGRMPSWQHRAAAVLAAACHPRTQRPHAHSSHIHAFCPLPPPRPLAVISSGNARKTHRMTHLAPFFFLVCGGHSTTRIASSKTCFSPFCVSAEHSRYLMAPIALD